MTNSSTSSPQSQRSAAGASLRKTNKPLMEKRRRARINDSLSQLKSLVIQSSKKDSSQFNKLEKADILELTVKHLRNLQSRDQHQQMAQASGTDSAGKYCAGFVECANEVIRFLKQSQGFTDDVKARVVGHLASCLQFTSNQSYSKSSAQLTTAPATAAGSQVLSSGAGSVLGSAQPTAAAQLSNGQIIHIVNAPFPNAGAKPSPVAPNGQIISAPQHTAPAKTSVSPIAPAPIVSLPQQQQYTHSQQPEQQSLMSSVSQNIDVPTSMPPAPIPSPVQDKSYSRFSQPLHIQIPATSVSPFVIKADARPAPQPLKRIDENNNINSISLNNKANSGNVLSSISNNHQHPHPHPKLSLKPVHQLPSISPAETTSSNRSSSPPSPMDIPTIPSMKFDAKSKHVHFYAPKEDHIANDYMPRHRTYSMTSSSSESEMSPLNLSQSPVSTSSTTSSYDYSKDAPCPSHTQTRDAYHHCLPLSYKLEKISPPSGYNPYDQSQHSSHHHLGYRTELPESMDLAPSSFTSVIVNGGTARRTLDMSQPKYMSMEIPEEDRLCPRPHGTPSPASSMGEERLWRPW